MQLPDFHRHRIKGSIPRNIKGNNLKNDAFGGTCSRVEGGPKCVWAKHVLPQQKTRTQWNAAESSACFCFNSACRLATQLLHAARPSLFSQRKNHMPHKNSHKDKISACAASSRSRRSSSSPCVGRRSAAAWAEVAHMSHKKGTVGPHFAHLLRHWAGTGVFGGFWTVASESSRCSQTSHDITQRGGRPRIRLSGCGHAFGFGMFSRYGGLLHWLVTPFLPLCLFLRRAESAEAAARQIRPSLNFGGVCLTGMHSVKRLLRCFQAAPTQTLQHPAFTFGPAFSAKLSCFRDGKPWVGCCFAVSCGCCSCTFCAELAFGSWSAFLTFVSGSLGAIVVKLSCRNAVKKLQSLTGPSMKNEEYAHCLPAANKASGTPVETTFFECHTVGLSQLKKCYHLNCRGFGN